MALWVWRWQSLSPINSNSLIFLPIQALTEVVAPKGDLRKFASSTLTTPTTGKVERTISLVLWLEQISSVLLLLSCKPRLFAFYLISCKSLSHSPSNCPRSHHPNRILPIQTSASYTPCGLTNKTIVDQGGHPAGYLAQTAPSSCPTVRKMAQNKRSGWKGGAREWTPPQLASFYSGGCFWTHSWNPPSWWLGLTEGPARKLRQHVR